MIEDVASLAAVLAIQRLKARYAELVDARYTPAGVVDADTLDDLARAAAQLFTEDATWDGGPALGVVTGRDGIARRLRAPTLRFARHLFTNPQVDVDGDTATGRWQLLSPLVDAHGRGRWLQGVEHDTYRRVDGAWLHASMRLETVFVGRPDDAFGQRERRPADGAP